MLSKVGLTHKSIDEKSIRDREHALTIQQREGANFIFFIFLSSLYGEGVGAAGKINDRGTQKTTETAQQLNTSILPRRRFFLHIVPPDIHFFILKEMKLKVYFT
jgi:hypothetical protein